MKKRVHILIFLIFVMFLGGCATGTVNGQSRRIIMLQRGIQVQVHNLTCPGMQLVLISPLDGDQPIGSVQYGKPQSFVVQQTPFRDRDRSITLIAQIRSGNELVATVSESFSEHLNGSSATVVWMIGEDVDGGWGDGVHTSRIRSRNGRGLCSRS